MNGIRKELGHGEHRYIREMFMLRERHSIRDHDLLYRRVFQALDCRSRKNAMGGAAIDIARALRVHNAYRLRNAVIAMAAFLYNSKWRIQAISKLARFLCKALVGRNDDEIT